MKKIFSIVATCMSALVLAFIVTLCFIKTDVTLVSGEPIKILVYNKSTASTVTNGYTKDNQEYFDILEELEKLTSVSIFTRIVKDTDVNPVIEQDAERKFAKWSTDIKLNNIVIELFYDKQQDLIVYVGEDSRVISFAALSIVIPIKEEFSDIILYYSETNNQTDSSRDESYMACTPLYVKGVGKSFLKYVKDL